MAQKRASHTHICICTNESPAVPRLSIPSRYDQRQWLQRVGSVAYAVVAQGLGEAAPSYGPHGRAGQGSYCKVERPVVDHSCISHAVSSPCSAHAVLKYLGACLLWGASVGRFPACRTWITRKSRANLPASLSRFKPFDESTASQTRRPRTNFQKTQILEGRDEFRPCPNAPANQRLATANGRTLLLRAWASSIKLVCCHRKASNK